MCRAMIVEDHPFIRASVALLLGQDGITIAGEADNGREALQMVRGLSPDLAIVDISMPLLDGLTVIQRFKSLRLPTKVLVLSSLPAEFYSLRCMKAGACGFVAKNNELMKWRKAVRAVRAGYSYFPDVTFSSVRWQDSLRTERECLAQLSDRETLVLHHLGERLHQPPDRRTPGAQRKDGEQPQVPVDGKTRRAVRGGTGRNRSEKHQLCGAERGA